MPPTTAAAPTPAATATATRAPTLSPTSTQCSLCTAPFANPLIDPVRLDPCGCHLCKDCMIQWLVAPRPPPVAAAATDATSTSAQIQQLRTCPRGCYTPVHSHFYVTAHTHDLKLHNYQRAAEQQRLSGDTGASAAAQTTATAPSVTAVAAVPVPGMWYPSPQGSPHHHDWGHYHREHGTTAAAAAATAHYPPAARSPSRHSVPAPIAACPAKRKRTATKVATVGRTTTATRPSTATTTAGAGAAPSRNCQRSTANNNDTNDNTETTTTTTQPPHFRKHFQKRVNEFLSYKEAHNGNGSVYRDAEWLKKNPQHRSFYNWVATVRRGLVKLSDCEREHLTSLGFDFQAPLLGYFAERFQELVTYKEANGGNCNAPPTREYLQADPKNKRLMDWVTRLRNGRHSVNDEERAQLVELGFAWEKPASLYYRKRKTFEERLEDLQEYKRQQGNCNIPHRYLPNLSLAEWVKDVRRGHLKVSQTQRQALNKVGFVWETKYNRFDREWLAIYNRIKEYCETHGGMPPTCSYHEKKLPYWIHTQRQLYVKKKLRADRQKLLLAIGFPWKGDQGRRPARVNDDVYSSSDDNDSVDHEPVAVNTTTFGRPLHHH